ncbi:MAG: ArnT family glycosyltransferase, partial [Chloroflexota bacterium]
MSIKKLQSDRSGVVFLLLLAAIFALALFMRVYGLDSVPLGVHYDEILNGEIALDALRDGPQYFYDRAGGREGLYHLFLTASFALPMPVAWQLRLPSVILSLLGLILTYLWVARAFGRWAAVTATGLMAVSFWTVWMGRAALRVNTVTPIAAGAALLMVYLLVNDERNPISWRNRISLAKQLGLGFVIGLCFYTYRAGYM